MLLDIFGALPLFDAEGFSELAARLLLNGIATALLVMGVYRKYNGSREFSFTFIIFNVLIFFACFVMSGMQVETGFALGLFAIFGILRYRTDTVPIKEMTYLLAVIVLAVINALPRKDLSVAELMFMNGTILLLTLLMERLWYGTREHSKVIHYENITLIQPDKRNDLIEDLKNRIGVDVTHVEIMSIDLLKDSAHIKIYYKL